MQIILIILGGALGALSRYGVSTLQAKWITGISWPSTLIVNLAGCFGLGICYSLWKSGSLSESSKFFWMIGFWASFTTFSTFGMDMFEMLEAKHYKTLVSYIALSITLGVILFYAGCLTGKRF